MILKAISQSTGDNDSLAMKFLIILPILLVGLGIVNSTQIGNSLTHSFEINPTGLVNILITLNSGTKSVLNRVQLTNFLSREEKLNFLVSSLKSHAASHQKNILEFLTNTKINRFPELTIKSFWISNQIYVLGADKTLVQDLATGFPEISQISKEIVVARDELFPGLSSRSALKVNNEKIRKGAPPANAIADEITWGLTRIRADLVWNLGINGSGIRVATIDTGVRGTHETLRENYLGDYGWYEPKGMNSVVPSDENGHGTHTTGTVAGRRGIGVAPGSKWMACRICMDGTPECYLPDLIACGQFFLCPTEPDGESNPDCTQAPHVINNSWGHMNDEDGWSFDAVIDAWLAAGIVPVFSMGNGNTCNQSIYPGSLERVIAVGGTAPGDKISMYSSQGPSADGHVKPDIAAPGANTRSASYANDTGYETMDGTSMASPHVAGVAALLLSYKSDLTVDQIKKYLFDGASLDYTVTGLNCGNVIESRSPNNAFGHGILDAYRSIQLLKADFPPAVPAGYQKYRL